MIGQRSQEFRFRSPSGGLITYPMNRVRALLDHPDQVVATVDDLVQAGFQRHDIVVLDGPQGAERLDVTGRHHGLRGRVARFIEHLGDEFEQLLVAAEHLRAGGLLIMVRADHDNKRAAVRILEEHGGARMIHFGRLHWEPLG